MYFKDNTIWTRSGRYYAKLDNTGKLGLFTWDDKEVWKSPKGGDFVNLKNDGNLVNRITIIYDISCIIDKFN